MRVLMFGAALLIASTSIAFADDTMTAAPAAPAPDAAAPAAPAPDAATTTTTTTTTTATTTTAGDPLAPLYGNTLIATAKGYVVHTYYSADHTFKGMVPAVSYPIQGTWELSPTGAVCRTFNPEPPGVTNPDCDAGPMPAHVVGDVWKDAENNDVSIVAGVQ